MNFEDIPARILKIRVRRADGTGAALQAQPVFAVDVKTARQDEFDIRLKDALVSVTPVIKPDVRRLASELVRGDAYLAQLANPAVDGSIELWIAFFTGECREMGSVEIGVDEYVEAAMAKAGRGKRLLQGSQLYKRLEELCCFRQGEAAFFFMLAGPAIDRELRADTAPESGNKSDGDEEEQSETADEPTEDSRTLRGAPAAPKAEPSRNNSFCVAGDRLRFVATETSLAEGGSIYTITRMTKHRNDPDGALRLVRGNLRFVDWTKAGQIQILARAQMSALARDDDGYLKKWDEFGDLEGEILLKRAREFGCLQYCDLREGRAGDDGKGTVSIHVSEASEPALRALIDGDVPEIEVTTQIPEYLTNQRLTFKEFVSGIQKEVEVEILSGIKKGRQEARPYFKVTEYDPESKRITLATESLPEDAGQLILSLAGEVAQIKRRIEARSKILEGRAANPQLGPLIEEKGRIAPARIPKKIDPLTEFVRTKIFEKPPTLMQEKAIDVALNTPDIAIIQGPPGTGKTTVIAAILERLNEIADKRGKSIKGQVLLTGFQHDAVENMISRLSLNGLPVPKFGRRADAEEDEVSVFEKNLEAWCSKIASDLRARNPQLDNIQREEEIKTLCLQYIQAPTRALAADLAAQIASLGIAILGEDGARRAANLAKRLSLEEKLNDESSQLLDAVRRIRVRPESFADDGPERAADALDDLKEVLEESERSLLDAASLWRSEDGDMPFLQDLATLKKSLLVRFTARPVFRVEKQNDEVIALAEDAISRIKTVGYSAKDAKSAALAEFLAELESNPFGMIDAVSDYSFAFAATCQQSVSHQMRRMKAEDTSHVGDAETEMEYEYVIVDEAARVSPRDLMVPMVHGKRIILVGDHRQLPHIIDDAVARQMEAGETGLDESGWLKKSMFQYLFSERLKTLEENDQILRRVTLDTQYRMHPVLGNFVSRNFYERFDPIEKFRSGRAAAEFAHHLPGTDNKPAVWLDVPITKGKTSRHGHSWTRRAEATAIAHQLREWMSSDEGKNLTFGVISFYKPQAELIRKQLARLAGDDGKLRVGTVDSFQGMEFDVVFLSTVRTAPQQWKPKGDDRERQARGLFGHLCLYNRLNVSMSRQKKLLVVAGDSGLLKNDLAPEFIPGLVDYFKLCEDEGRILQCR